MQESWKLNFVEFVAFSVLPARTRLCRVLYKLAKIRFVLESPGGQTIFAVRHPPRSPAQPLDSALVYPRDST
jgi:hypothetical protein